MSTHPPLMACQECKRGDIYEVVLPTFTSDRNYEGSLRSVTAHNVPAFRCDSCGHLLFDFRADDLLSAALRSHLGLMQPEEIFSKRRARRLTQRSLAEATGIAEETINRWERGHRIQSRAHDKLLRAFFKVPGLFADQSRAIADQTKTMHTAQRVTWTRPPCRVPLVGRAAEKSSLQFALAA